MDAWRSWATLTTFLVTGAPLAAQDSGATDFWERYHATDEAHAWLERQARERPGFARLEAIGQSYRGRPLLVLAITDRSTGEAEEKPALYVDGNIHSGELTSGEVVLHLGRHLLGESSSPRELRELLRRCAFYLRPKFNPDGADLTLLKGVSLRSSVRPWDQDGDGRLDEDPAQDLNGDGFITRMRIQDPKGGFRASKEEPRLLVRRKEGDAGPFYRVMSEGLDDDGDGRFNEDGVGGLDMNRNFPRNWALPFKQRGAGPYPLSEPETAATVRFLAAHPNVVGVVHGHTSGGFIYRLPSASDPTAFDEQDLELIKALGRPYTERTGRPVRASATHPTRHRYGTLISWAYWDRGVIGWVPEYWPGLARSDRESLRIDDERFGGRYFLEWKPFDHPQLGHVEIGGWRSRFTRQNPPPEMLRAECELQLPWIVSLLERAPRLELAVTCNQLGGGRYSVEARVTNGGYLPTNLTRRGAQARVVAPPTIELKLQDARLLEGARRQRGPHLLGTWRLKNAAPDGKAAWHVRWMIQAGEDGCALEVVTGCPTAGTRRVHREL